MPTPSPQQIIQVLNTFAPAFTKPTFANALLLVYGTLLAVGTRTVTAALRAVGLAHHPNFTTYHRILNRARWSPLVLSRLLLGLLVETLLPADAPLVLVVDETLERRRGPKIAYKSFFRDAVRSTSSGENPVKSEGIRWLSVALLVKVPWSEKRQWALPFLTVPALAPATSAKLGKPHRTVIDRTQLLVRLVRRWQPDREVVLVGDGNYAAVRLGHTCRGLSSKGSMVRLVARLRLDATLHEPPGPQPEGKRGPKPKKGRREPSLQARLEDPESEWRTVSVPWYGGEEKTLELMTGTALWYRTGEIPLPIRWVLLRCPEHHHQSFPPNALFCTDPESSAQQIVGWLVGRWSIEVTFEEARAHLGMETQRQWSVRALGRSTPCLLGLFSVVVVLAQALHPEELPVRRAAWYAKEEATFIDALAAVRGELFRRGEGNYVESSSTPDLMLIPRSLWDSMHETLCYAA
ncbi:MAG: transposase [Actinobacteria bacterium]|nr:transposase [Actinomycetota bacterium]